MKVCVCIPAYNAAMHLAGVIARIPAECWAKLCAIWVIDDGSSDKTTAVAKRLQQHYKAIRIDGFEENRGYGEAVKRGLTRCRESDPDVCICLHADGQYPPEYMSRFIDRVFEGCDLVQGSRIASGTARSGGMPLYKYVANRTLTALENMVFGLKMSDYHSGYLAYSRKALTEIPFDSLSFSFDFDLEVIATARAAGMRIEELPIPTRYANEVSHLNPITYGFRVLAVMCRYMRGVYARAQKSG